MPWGAHKTANDVHNNNNNNNKARRQDFKRHQCEQMLSFLFTCFLVCVGVGRRFGFKHQMPFH